MKRILTSLVLILMGLYLMTQVAKLIGGYALLPQLVILTTFVIALSYLSVEVIVLMMRASNMMQKEDALMQTWHGHFSNVLGAFVLAYSYANKQLGLLFVGMVIIWLAMLLLTRLDRKKAQATHAQSDSALPGALEGIPNATERHSTTKIAASAVNPADARAEQAISADVKETDDQLKQGLQTADINSESNNQPARPPQKTATKPAANSKTNNAVPNHNAIAKEALLRAIADRKKEAPFIGVKLGGREITDTIFSALQDEKGVRIECALGIIGSLAGYACHVWAMEALKERGLDKDPMAIMLLEDPAGRTYYYGNLPNEALLESQYSVWSLVAGAVQNLTDKPLLDVNQLAEDTVQAVGKNFGVPDLPLQHMPSDLPINFVKNLWPALLPKIDDFCETSKERTMLLGLSAQEMIKKGKETICPMLAAEIVMKCALPMSKIGPEWLDAEYKRPY